MKPPPFTHHAPTSVEEAVRLLAELGPDVKVLAGGQSLVPVLNMRLASPAHLVDINRIEGLDVVEVTPDRVHIGATVRHAELERHEGAYAALPLLRQALQWVAHPAIRNRGTTVGSIVHADPAGEMPAVLALTGGTVTAVSGRGERTVAASELFVGPMESSLEADELVVSADFPCFDDQTVTAYHEFARRSGDYALAGVAVALRAEGNQVAAAKASFVSVTDVPDVCDLTTALTGSSLAGDADALAAVERAAHEHVDPVDDIHASADYRRHLSGVLCRRVVATALAHARERHSSGHEEDNR